MRPFHRLPLPALRVFEAAGRTCSFAQAAKELDLSPSAVSHAIRKLEAAAGLQLFHRATRAISLTPEGARLLDHVQRGLEEMGRGFDAVRTKAATPLRLHTAPAFATQWLIPRLARFVLEQPDIALRFSSDTNYAVFDNDDFDLDVVYGEPRSSAHEATPLLIEELTPLCSPALAARIQSGGDLYAQPLIHSDGQSVQWKGWFRANGMRVPDTYGLAFDRSSMAIAAAVDGLGVVMESTFLTQRELASGQLVAPLRSCTHSVRYVGHYLVQPRQLPRPDAAVRFRQWLMREIGVSAGTAS